MSQGELRTAEIVAVLALASDLSGRLPFQHGLRSTCYAARLAAAFELDADTARHVYFATALSGAGEAAADLATLLCLPAGLLDPADRDSPAGPIVRLSRELDLYRSRQPAAAAAMLRSSATRPMDRRVAAVAGTLELVPDDQAWEQVLAAEPVPHQYLSGADVDAALAALGLFGSLASPYFRGHSAAVSALAALVARERGLPDAQVRLVRHAGLVHDLGRAGVAREVWERPGPLEAEEWTQVRSGTEQSVQLLGRVPGLAEVSALAAAGGARSELAEILAVANAYCAMVADRPHRPAMSAAAAATALRADAISGRFDAEVVDAVLRASAGQPVVRS